MESGNYGKVNFYNISETFPARFIAGPDYWMHFNSRFCCFVRTADILRIRRQDETTRVYYNAGDVRRGKNIAIGVSLVITYKEDSASAKKNKNVEESLFFQKGEQYQEALELIRRQCPQYQSWTGSADL